MPELKPLYTAQNCRFSHPLQWGMSVFWHSGQDDDAWVNDLAAALDPDGIRLLGHRFKTPGVSQFAISTKLDVAPVTIAHRVKGRLQYCVRERLPKALKGNYALRSFGKVTRSVVEGYVASQLGHHEMADPRVQERLARFQIHNPDVDLSQPQHTSHAIYWYDLHVVLVHRERWNEVREGVLEKVRAMILGACVVKGWLLSRAAILADHVHLVVGPTIDDSPQDVALSLLNNLAYAHGMKPVYQFGGFLGTVGEYDQRVVRSDASLR